MFLMSKHGKPQSLILIKVQTSEKKNALGAFYQTPNVNPLTVYLMKCMNM